MGNQTFSRSLVTLSMGNSELILAPNVRYLKMWAKHDFSPSFLLLGLLNESWKLILFIRSTAMRIVWDFQRRRRKKYEKKFFAQQRTGEVKMNSFSALAAFGSICNSAYEFHRLALRPRLLLAQPPWISVSFFLRWFLATVVFCSRSFFWKLLARK